jgi:hypothetical protein
LNENGYNVGSIVEVTTSPEWGPGKIVHVSGETLHIIFRDLEEEMARKFRPGAPSLRIAAQQSDPILDNLPPLEEKDGRWMLPKRRYSFETLKRQFLHMFPAGFADPKYLGEERDYKLAAHVHFQSELGIAKAKSFLANGELRELARRGLSVLGAVNLISPYESAAFHDAMKDEDAIASFFSTLLRLLDSDEITESSFTDFANAVCSLPAERGKVATWPVATVFPYLARPDRFMFLKPQVTKTAADTLGFDLKYDAAPNWRTYDALLRMGSVYFAMLKPMGARDFVDVQSFIYVSCHRYDATKFKVVGSKN